MKETNNYAGTTNRGSVKIRKCETKNVNAEMERRSNIGRLFTNLKMPLLFLYGTVVDLSRIVFGKWDVGRLDHKP